MKKEAQPKKNFLQKIKLAFGNKPEEVSNKAEEKEEANKPKPSDPIDLTFVKHFTAAGGKFLYCEDDNEVYHNLNMMIREGSWNCVYCKDENLTSILSKANIPHKNEDFQECDAFFTSCENLIAFNGGVMVSANQTFGKKIAELPKSHIIIATTEQLVKDLGEGLSSIRERYEGNNPSLITTIKGPIQSDVEPNTETKELYLLLVENI